MRVWDTGHMYHCIWQNTTGNTGKLAHLRGARAMWASEARAILEQHLGAFFAASPGDIPADLVEGVSPLFAMGLAHGLSLASAGRYIGWLQHTGKVTEQQARELQGIVAVTEQALEQVQQRHG
jgi:hypothetical protein